MNHHSQRAAESQTQAVTSKIAAPYYGDECHSRFEEVPFELDLPGEVSQLADNRSQTIRAAQLQRISEHYTSNRRPIISTKGHSCLVQFQDNRQRNQLCQQATRYIANIQNCRTASAPIQCNGPRGLPNRHFDCFLNAVLQIMAGPYVNYFNPESNPLLNVPDQTLQLAVWKILVKVNTEDLEAVSKKEILSLRQMLVKRGFTPSTDNQEDAAEVMRHLLELVIPAKDSVGLRRERRIDPTDTREYTGQLPSDPAEYHDGISNGPESTNMIPVDLDRYNSLNAFLYHKFGKGVPIEYDEKNRVKALSDGKPVSISKVTERFAFTRLPNVLTFNLHRFRITGRGRERLNKSFDVPHSLFLIEEPNSGTKAYVEYELAGVVVQTGSLSGGHYRSHVKRNKTWYEANDETISEGRVERERDKGYIYTFRQVKRHTSMPKGSASAQETKPSLTEIDLSGAEYGYNGLLEFTDVLIPTTKDESETSSDRIFGLPNRKNDCFLLAVLQLFANSYGYLLDSKKNTLPKEKQHFQNWLASIVDAINKKSRKIGGKEIGRLRERMKRSNLLQGTEGQEDAAELFRHLLLYLSPSSGKSSNGDKLGVGIERIFEKDHAHSIDEKKLGSNPTVYKNQSATSKEIHSAIEVDIVDFNSLEGFLYARYGRVGQVIEYDIKNRPKVLDNDEAVELSGVRERRYFTDLPPVLTFILHRFKEDSEGRRERISKPFIMPEELTLLEDNGKSQKKIGYALSTVVAQRGGLEGGHYYTHRLDTDGKTWLTADDSNVTSRPNLGQDLNLGYLYTYTRLSAPKKNVPVAQNHGHQMDNLGKRLSVEIFYKRYDKALQLLDIPGIPLNTLFNKKTALHWAIEHKQSELIQRLLLRGADPLQKDSSGQTALDLGRRIDLDKSDRMLLELNALRGSRELIREEEPNSDIELETAKSLLDSLKELETLIFDEISTLTDPLDSDPEQMNRLAGALKQVWEQRKRANKRVAKALGIRRAGPGGRPDAKGGRLPELTDSQQKTLSNFLSEGSFSSPKLREEALTAVFAVSQKLFTNATRGDFIADIDLSADREPWDQKTMFVDQYGGFTGRLEHTHTKTGARLTDKTEPEKSMADEKTGLLIDSTYTRRRNYERSWSTVLGLVLDKKLDPKKVREVHADNPEKMISEREVDPTTKEKEPWMISVMKAEEMATQGTPRSSIHSDQLSWENHLVDIIKGIKRTYTLHADHRGWLPGGVLYFEFPSGSKDPKKLGGNHCKLVISHDFQNIYLTCSHYKGFTILNKDKLNLQKIVPVSREPFYEIVPSSTISTLMERRKKQPKGNLED